jgi:hypothetical protein
MFQCYPANKPKFNQEYFWELSSDILSSIRLSSRSDEKSAGGSSESSAARASFFLLPLPVRVSDLRQSLFQLAQDVSADLRIRGAAPSFLLLFAHRRRSMSSVTVIAADTIPVTANIPTDIA